MPRHRTATSARSTRTGEACGNRGPRPRVGGQAPVARRIHEDPEQHMQVEIWSDIACPWCYVGKRRFEAALEGFAHRDEVTVTWHSFELDPRAPQQQDAPQPELLARKYGTTLEQAHAMNARMSEAAAGEGLTFQLDQVKVGNTFNAHRLLHFSAERGQREALGERLFEAYLGEGAALGDTDTLVALATDVGLDATTYARC